MHPLMLITLASARIRDWPYRKNRIAQNLLLIKQLFSDTLFIVKLDHSKTGVLEATIMLYEPFLIWSPINYTNRLVYCRHHRVWSFLLHSSRAIWTSWSTRTRVGNGFYFTVMLTKMSEFFSLFYDRGFCMPIAFDGRIYCTTQYCTSTVQYLSRWKLYWFTLLTLSIWFVSLFIVRGMKSVYF